MKPKSTSKEIDVNEMAISFDVDSELIDDIRSGKVKHLHIDICDDNQNLVLENVEGNLVLERLGGAGLQCIALKGWEMRKLYPDRIMRQMADLDILVRPYEFKQIKTVMEGLGYTSDGESSWKHDSFRKGEVHIEMHKRLTDDSGVIQS